VKRLPIYDDTAPIACTASPPQLEERIDTIERLRSHLEHVERTEDGLVLRFPNTAAIEAELHQFVVDEKGCCQFWGFEITSTPDGLSLRWDGPPSVSELMDQLAVSLRGDEPITALSGLL
jgi:hypothetical protein